MRRQVATFLSPSADLGACSASDVLAWITSLPRLDRAVDDTERIAQLGALERLKSAAAAAQAVVTADFVASQRAAQRAAGVPADRVGQGVARPGRAGPARVAAPWVPARRAGPGAGPGAAGDDGGAAGRGDQRVAGHPRGPGDGLPDPATGATADAELAAPGELGDRQVEAEARKIAYRLDPQAFVARSRGAARDRRVTLRPAPDTMARLSGFLPVAQGVAAYAALSREADRLRAEGDPRGRGQIMADTLVERLTGQATADGAPVEVNLVITDGDHVGADDEPADLTATARCPPTAARDLVRDTGRDGLAAPALQPTRATRLVAMESRRRLFPEALRRLLVVRDQVCRTPWCGAPIRHADHVIPVRRRGHQRGQRQGLCEACNYAKQAPAGRHAPDRAGAGDQVETTTPTGHTYRSRPPPLPGRRRGPGRCTARSQPDGEHLSGLLTAA